MDEIEVEATVLGINIIRLKFHGVPDDKGPDLIIDEITARKIITTLQTCLPEFNKQQ